MRAVYLIRHGEPLLSQKSSFCLGRMDVPLSQEGAAQAARLGEYFQKLPEAFLAASPLQRCRQTAARLPGEARLCEGLLEVDMGQWTGLDFSEIRARWPMSYAQRGERPVETLPPGGESLAQCGVRVWGTFRKLLRECPEKDLILVAHNGVNRMLYAALAGQFPEECLKLPQPYGGVTQLLLEGERAVAGLVGRRPEELPPPVPDEETCLELLRRFGTPVQVVDHGRAVAETALELWERLDGQGVRLNKKLCFAGGLLHDVARTERGHAGAGARWLTEQGYAAVGAVVGCHMELPEEQEGRWSEKTLVFLADKLVRERERVTLEERFFSRPAPEKLPYLQRRYRQAKRLLEMLERPEDEIKGVWK